MECNLRRVWFTTFTRWYTSRQKITMFLRIHLIYLGAVIYRDRNFVYMTVPGITWPNQRVLNVALVEKSETFYFVVCHKIIQISSQTRCNIKPVFFYFGMFSRAWSDIVCYIFIRLDLHVYYLDCLHRCSRVGCCCLCSTWESLRGSFFILIRMATNCCTIWY